MSPMDALRDAIDPALAELPPPMTSDAARVMLVAIGLQESRLTDRVQRNGGPARGKIRRPEQARQRLPGLTTNLPISEVRQMADEHFTRAPDARSPNGTPLFNNPCPDCGVVRLSDKRKLGSPCMACANKRRSTHGMTNSPIYSLWTSMVARCTYQSTTHYRYYGGRGIKVCDEWKVPAVFIEWAMRNGYKRGLELDRIDVDGPYAPFNCRFLTHRENSQLRRNARCDSARAQLVKDALAKGASVRAAATAACVPYMTAWHISKGNTWQ